MKSILNFIGVKNVKELKKAINKNETLALEFLEITKQLFKESLSDLKTLKGKQDLKDYLKSDMGFLKHEEFKVLFLSSSNQIVYEESLRKFIKIYFNVNILR